MGLPLLRGTPRIPGRMKIFHWARYCWNADTLGEPAPGKLPVNCVVRPAARRDLDAVQLVIENSFTLDTDWAEYYKRFRAGLAELVELAFEQSDSGCLVLAHGTRIIGASVYTLDPAGRRIISSQGPCRPAGIPESRARVRHPLADPPGNAAAGRTQRKCTA